MNWNNATCGLFSSLFHYYCCPALINNYCARCNDAVMQFALVHNISSILGNITLNSILNILTRSILQQAPAFIGYSVTSPLDGSHALTANSQPMESLLSGQGTARTQPGFAVPYTGVCYTLSGFTGRPWQPRWRVWQAARPCSDSDSSPLSCREKWERLFRAPPLTLNRKMDPESGVKGVQELLESGPLDPTIELRSSHPTKHVSDRMGPKWEQHAGP